MHGDGACMATPTTLFRMRKPKSTRGVTARAMAAHRTIQVLAANLAMSERMVMVVVGHGDGGGDAVGSAGDDGDSDDDVDVVMTVLCTLEQLQTLS